MSILIIGASGYIGNQVLESLKKHNGGSCIGTAFHSKNEELIKFDLLNDDISEIDKRMTGKQKYVLICAADTNIEYCLSNKEEAYEKNVTATIRVINQLKNLNYHITFLSSDNVFDGEKGNYTEEDIAIPINEYGKMKKEVEQYLMKEVPNSCIMRIGKTIGNFTCSKDLLVEWYGKVLRNETISCIEGNVFNFTYVNDIVNCYALIVEKKLIGLYHIVGNESGSRKEYCQEFLRFLNCKNLVLRGRGKVIEKDIEQFNFCEKRPLKISMNNKKFIDQTGYNFMELDDIWEKFLNEYK